MVTATPANHVMSVRNWGLELNDPKVRRLAVLERSFPGISTPKVQSERSYLLHAIADVRHQTIVSQILRPSAPNSTVKALEEKTEKLREFFHILQTEQTDQPCKAAFSLLPGDVQELFCWAVWVHFGVPDKPDFGREKLTEQISLISTVQTPLLFTSGKSLCDQALHYYENLCAIERQRDSLHRLQELSLKLQSPFSNFTEVREVLSCLPTHLQWRMHGDIYAFSTLRKMEKCWGEKQLMGNPKLLTTLRNPESKETCLLEQYIKEHEETLKSLKEVSDLEEFERFSLVSSSMSLPQRKAMLRNMSPHAKARALEFEEAAGRRALLDLEDCHLYQWRGAHPIPAGTSFQVFAPNAIEVYLVLTAYGKEEHSIPMKRNHLGVWEVFTEHARAGRTYRYRVLDSEKNWRYRTDPFGMAVMEHNGIAESVVCKIDSYTWNDRDWMKMRAVSNPLNKPLSIYELSAELWKKHSGKVLNYRELAHEIVEYHKSFPFTHIELYAVLDHKHDYSWGYQPAHFLAPNRRMGGPDDFKFLVDLCHQNGIGVILDWIPTHFKDEHNGDLSESLHMYDGTNLFAGERSPWETLYLDYDKEETRRLLLASALYWLEMTHVDGLRIDAVGPMLKRDGKVKDHAVGFLKELNRIAHERYPGVLMIAEDTDGFPNMSRPVKEGGVGFDVKVGVYLQWRTRNYFKTPYDERGKSEHHFDKLVRSLGETGGHERWMLANSHDDDAAGAPHRHSTLYASMPAGDSWRRFADMRLFHAWNLLAPGAGHMIHMGDELGQRWAWNGRLHTQEGAVEWHVLDCKNPDSGSHLSFLGYVGDLNRFYCSKPAFWKHADWGYKPISNNAENGVIGFHRLDYEGSRLAVFYNFSTFGYREYDFPLPSLQDDPDLGRIKGAREIFNSDAVKYGGTGDFGNERAHILRDGSGSPTHFRFAMPPLSVLVFEEVWT